MKVVAIGALGGGREGGREGVMKLCKDKKDVLTIIYRHVFLIPWKDLHCNCIISFPDN